MTAPKLGVVIVGRLPNGKVEGIHLETPEGATTSITRAAQTGRYTEILAATVFQRIKSE